MTPEREIAIRKQFSTDNHLPLSIHMPVIELLAEIDRLRGDSVCKNVNCKSGVKHHNVWCDYIVQSEIDQLREKLADSELFRENTYKNLLEAEQYRDEWQRLFGIAVNERNEFQKKIASAVEALEQIGRGVTPFDASSTRDCIVAKEALAKIRGEN